MTALMRRSSALPGRGPNRRSRVVFAGTGAASSRGVSGLPGSRGGGASPRRRSWPRCGHCGALTTGGRLPHGCTGSLSTGRSTGPGCGPRGAKSDHGHSRHAVRPAPDRRRAGPGPGRAHARPSGGDRVALRAGPLPGRDRSCAGCPRGTVNSRLRRGLTSSASSLTGSRSSDRCELRARLRAIAPESDPAVEERAWGVVRVAYAAARAAHAAALADDRTGGRVSAGRGGRAGGGQHAARGTGRWLRDAIGLSATRIPGRCSPGCRAGADC